jgi:hypothetical protein
MDTRIQSHGPQAVSTASPSNTALILACDPVFGAPRARTSQVQVAIDEIIELLILAIPVASISWTVTHEEVFREPREWCSEHSRVCQRLFERKFFYLFTCEYCFSHYVSALFLVVTGFRLLFPDWRGYLIAGFSLV